MWNLPGPYISMLTWLSHGAFKGVYSFLPYTRYDSGFRASPVHEEFVTVYGTFHLLFAQLPDGFSILVMAERALKMRHVLGGHGRL